MNSERQAPIPSVRWLRPVLTALIFVSSAATAVACPLCYEAAKQMVTIGQQLNTADRVVIARPDGSTSHFRIASAIKGDDADGATIVDPVQGPDGTVPSGCDPCLLIHYALNPHWTALGTMPPEYAAWLRQLIATYRTSGELRRASWPQRLQPSTVLNDAGSRQCISLVLPRLESPDALVAQIAWQELAHAPYQALETVRSRIDAGTVERWLNDPKLASRHATYTLVLGFVGGSADAERLEQKMEAARTSHDATNLAAMIGADLELRGPSRIGWVEATYFADHTRTMPEIEAALLALNVHGEASGTISREQVIEAYRVFIRERPAMAGFVALQLADWNYWDAATEYAALLKSDAVKDPASQFAVVNYLQRAAAAKAALQ
ncbi:hypothetical protein PY650_31560 [Rhizobium calliandrae]|uniref:Uncharacterized protein n=1 Tax=Rhizobium calliandrae TaxID=1312182 RepID=A0ABT7KQ00_9HYPH|nr:hypothetical protein [Rhizobium calliandrae]MDL2410075.1 hypothetical protein [Rhizobium calliandrae]